MKNSKKSVSRAKVRSGRPRPKLAAREGSRLEPLDYTETKEATLDGEPLLPRDPNFREELQYEGYDSIEESDNDELEANVDRQEDDTAHELTLDGRPEDEDVATEESWVDRQERYGS